MAKDTILEEIFQDLDAAESDELRLTISGEALARLNEQLKKAPKHSEKAYDIAGRILILAEIHTKLLSQGDDHNGEAPLTMCGELCFILSMEINPEKLPLIYVGSLLSLANLLGKFAFTQFQPGNSDNLFHMNMAISEVMRLALVTYDKFSKLADLSCFATEINNIRPLEEKMPEELKTLHDKPITPYMAMDVLYDVIARFMACGLIDREEFNP